MNLGKPKYRVDLVEKDGKHFYTFDGDKTLFPGVTGVLDVISKYHLIPWAAKETAFYTQNLLKKCRQIHGLSAKELLSGRFLELLYKRSKKQHKLKKEKAADIGTRAHKAIDEIIKGKSPSVDPDIEWCVENFFTWYENSGFEFVSGDMKVGSQIYGFGGSIDGLVKDKTGNLLILDFKTSNQIDPVGYSAQTSAYAYSVSEMFEIDNVPGSIIVRFSKIKPEFEIAYVNGTNRIFKNIFIPALTISKSIETVLLSHRETFRDKRRSKK